MLRVDFRKQVDKCAMMRRTTSANVADYTVIVRCRLACCGRVCKNRFLNAVEAIFTGYASICGTLKVRLRCISAGENNE
jgi:hypothetical protein